jgi:hypothetical protein
MTDRSSELTLVLHSSDSRIVAHGSLFVAWRHRIEGMHDVSARPRFLASNAAPDLAASRNLR